MITFIVFLKIEMVGNNIIYNTENGMVGTERTPIPLSPPRGCSADPVNSIRLVE